MEKANDGFELFLVGCAEQCVCREHDRQRHAQLQSESKIEVETIRLVQCP